MARWRIQAAHYLTVPGTEWEHKEVSDTGRQLKKNFPVPLFLDPRDPGCYLPNTSELVVGYVGKCNPRTDIIFEGEPTPDMEPLDEEAKAISEKLQSKWHHPIDMLPGDHSAILLDKFMKQFDAAVMKAGGIPEGANVSAGMISADQFAALQAQVAQLAEQNAELMTRLAEKPSERRV